MQMDLEVVTNNNINNDTKYNYTSKDHVPPFNTDYTEFDVSSYSEECLKITIGTNGKNLKKITENNNIAYIYHNKSNNKFEIWGNQSKFSKVINEIKNYLNWAYNYLYIRDNTL